MYYIIRFTPPTDLSIRAKVIREVRPFCSSLMAACRDVDSGNIHVYQSIFDTQEAILHTAVRLESLGLDVSIEDK